MNAEQLQPELTKAMPPGVTAEVVDEDGHLSVMVQNQDACAFIEIGADSTVEQAVSDVASYAKTM